MKKSIAAAIVLGLATFSGSAAANDDLRTRLMVSAGAAIAAQGNAALAQIREELKDSLMDQIKPYLPKPAQETPAEHPAERAQAGR